MMQCERWGMSKQSAQALESLSNLVFGGVGEVQTQRIATGMVEMKFVARDKGDAARDGFGQK